MSTLPRELDLARTINDALTPARRDDRRIERCAKRALDVATAAIALAIASVPMLLIALAIKLDSRGPALLRQPRVKMGGEIFTFFKFRTMREDADHVSATADLENEHEGPIFKMREDPRRTRVGKFLRKSSLDELPNLFDVLLGHMSIVGPRPPLPHEVAAYDARELRRLSAKPGMTGLWQVSGRSLLSWDDTVRLDLEYIETWSLWRDLVIIARTLPAVILARGAY
ncbi:MAG: sugar transferase [Chloroflexota bacterium]|nr:sugar transferase [Chloroflexota bacterium]